MTWRIVPAVAVLALSAGVWVYTLIQRNASLRAEIDALRATIQGTQDAQNAVNGIPTDDADIIDRLRSISGPE